SGKAQALELSNSTPQSVSSSTPINFTITSVTNPTSSNHSFYARVLTFTTASAMTSAYTISGTTRTGTLPNSIDHGGMALSTDTGIGITFQVPEAITFCVSGSSIGGNCSGLSTPIVVLGHSVGGGLVLSTAQVDTANAYVQTSTNAQTGIVVRMRDTNLAASCGGLSRNNGTSCAIPAVNTSCGGSCSATTITAGTAALGLCIQAGSGNTT